MTPLKTVLIIDDDIKFCEGLKLALKMSEINSNIANTPQEALKLVKNNDYYMILVDMFLTPPTLATIKDCPPKCNGIILTKKIKEIKPKIPVIMVSGYKNKIAHQDFLDAGGFAILDKIINVEQLNKIIEDCSKHYEENG